MTKRFPVVLGMAALAIVSACGGSDDSSANSDNGSADIVVPAAVLETSALTIVGDPLPQLGDPNNDPGGTAPVVTGQSFDGTEISIGGPTEKPTMYVFLAHWCPHCNSEIPRLNNLRDNGEIPATIDVVGISTVVGSDRPNFPPSEWITDKGWTWPVLADSENSDALVAFGGTGIPFTVMLDADGNVLGRKSGEASQDEIDDWIDKVLS